MADESSSMVAKPYVMAGADQVALFGCSACGGVLHKPMLVGRCLHSVCLKCLDELLERQRHPSGSGGDAVADSNEGPVAGVPCPKCGTADTGCHPRPNHFLDVLTRSLGITRDDAVCDFCLEDGMTGRLADQWCAACGKYVCGPCSAWHSKFNKEHVTRPLLRAGTTSAADGLALPGTGGAGGHAAAACDTCNDQGAALRTDAESWCASCSVAMCVQCSAWHDRFHRGHGRVTLSPGDVIVRPLLSSSSSSTAVVAVCRQHDAKLEYFCDQCGSLKCTDCAKLCLESAHTMCTVDGGQVEERARRAAADVRSAQGAVRTVAGTLRRRADMVAELDRSRAADCEALSDNRRLVLAAVSRAFEQAEQEVGRHYDELRLRTSAAATAAGGVGVAWPSSLSARLGHALSYSAALLQAADAALVLDQRELVLRGLRSLADLASCGGEDAAEPRRIVRPLDDTLLDDVIRQLTGRISEHRAAAQAQLSAADSSNSQLLLDLDSAGLTLNSERDSGSASQEPERLDGAAADDVGSTVVTVNCIEEGTAEQLPPGGRRGVHRDSDRSVVGGGLAESAASVTGSVSLPVASCTFGVHGDCRDVAVTPDGRILLAALKKGVRQYDATGRKMPSWRPPKRDGRDKGCVSTVEALSDGRAAVGIINHSVIVLLRRASVDADAWSEEARIALRSQPYRLAAHGDRLVVAGARTTESRLGGPLAVVVNSKCGPGPDLDLVSTSDCTVLHSRKLDYDIISVMLTAKAAVVASSERQRPKSSGSWRYVVDAFDHQGALLWRHESDEEVYDFCESPAAAIGRVGDSGTAVVYVILPDSRRVVALDGATGCWLVDAYRAGHDAHAKPVRLAASHGREKTFVAILYLNDTVSVHPFDF